MDTTGFFTAYGIYGKNQLIIPQQSVAVQRKRSEEYRSNDKTTRSTDGARTTRERRVDGDARRRAKPMIQVHS